MHFNVLQTTHYILSDQERLKAPLKNVEFISKSLIAQCTGKLHIDNQHDQNVVHICQLGSAKPGLHELVSNIHTTCIVTNVIVYLLKLCGSQDRTIYITFL